MLFIGNFSNSILLLFCSLVPLVRSKYVGLGLLKMYSLIQEEIEE